ncbi:MAG: type II CRISPR RNA-guided endonuclease Cas9 [Candidatus Enterosoma sp.]|nr:type II CRISPR RNA-guided endonuclease Cas9 [Candidatus Enterosoma sp.]
MDKKFYLGLDIGTDSVGWAVTDENYNLIRKQGKHLWGARLFPEASDASTRRSNREARRRLQRRRWRIVLLQELFNDEMNKVDPNFFARLNNSALLESDKEEKDRTPYLLFNDNGYTDKNYMKKYPTIYHLRQEMINNPDHQYDIREIYLVMAHMIKYRGNFLTDGEISSEGIENNTQNIVSAFTDLDNELRELLEDGEDFVPFDCTEDIAKKLLSVFEKETRSRYLADEILKEFGKSDFSTLQKNLIKLISGSKMQVGALYPRIKEEDEEISKTSLELDSDNLEETLNKLAETLTDSEIAIINTCYSLYSFRILINLLKGKHYISDAMVEVYNTHREQLKTLKALVKRYNPSEFNHFFVKYLEKDGKGYRKNYVNYIGMTQKGRHKIRLPHSTNQEDLYKAIKSLLPFDKLNDETFPWQDDDKKKMQDILTALEAKAYLPRQNAKENGVFPYQLNKNEMNKIIDNQKKYYPFLGETSADYLNPNKQSYKLISLLEFKIPYFVGPLSNKMTEDDEDKESNFWMERKQEGKITPWNFHEMIDEDKTAAGFIERMKNACTYIIGEATLPKCSLLYSEYMLLNEINNWTINNQGLTKEVKEYLIENIYTKSSRTPTLRNIEECLKCYYKQSVEVLTKTGKELKSEDIHANLKSFVDMADDRAFGPEFYKDQKKYDLAEEVIFTITMFEDKDLKKKKLESLKLTPVQIKYFMGLKYKDWGKLSKKLLNGLTTELTNTSTGEVFDYTVIDLMRDFPLNLMEILETNDSEYTFREQISALNQETMPGRDSLIESSYASPAMKRAVRQTFKIIDELKQILHIDHFDTFFVECTRRDDQKNVRKSSRKKQLQELLANIKLEELADKDDLEKLLENKSEADLRRKKLFLYFIQMGRSVYTGEIIDLNRLDKDYDIDHIIPQAKLKDDSFLNTVLVEKDINNRKQDTYPLPSNVLTEKGREWVKKLNGLKGKDKTFQLMPADKMNRILRPTTKPLEDEELVGFVNRQLTMTDQSVKAVCEILRETEKESKIVFSKASNVSEFRNVFGLTKCREINDFHHANDAYLNIVVGNVYDKVFTSRFTVKLFQDHFKDDYRSWKIDVKNLFKRDEYAYSFINAGKCVWKAKHYQDDKKEIEDDTSTGTIDLVRKTLSWNDPMVTQMLFTQSAKQGFFNKISLHSAKEGNAAFPLKLKAPFNSDGWEKKYGGYNDLSAPYFMLVESDGKKNEKKYTLENIPSIFLASMDTEEKKLKFLTENYKLKNPKIVLDKLLIRTVIEFPHDDGKVRVGISGKSGNNVTFVNLSQIAFSNKDMVNYFKQISKILGINNPAAKKIDESILADKETIISNDITINKESNMIAFEYLQNNFLNKGCLKNLPGLGNKVVACSESKELFGTLSLINQMKTLIEIIKLGGHNSPTSDLTAINQKKLASMYLSCSKELPRPFRIIRQSPTGFYEKVLFEK